MTPDHRLVGRPSLGRRPARGRAVERLHAADRRTGSSTRSSSSTGRCPTPRCTSTLVDGSINGGELDLDAFIGGRPQALVVNESGRYQLFRIGDAVASRNIHAAIYDGRRIAMAL